jgi:hypothetical protein
MDKDALMKVGWVVAEPVGQLLLGIIHIVEALKNQPGFDRSSFDRDIKERLQKVERDSLTQSLLQSVL